MKKLTKRERILIYAVIIIGVVSALVFFVAMPVMSKMQDMQNEKEELTMQKQKMELEIASLADLKNSYEELRPEVLAEYDSFFEAAANTDIDKYLTGLCIKNGLEPVSLEIDPARNYMAGDEQSTEVSSEDGQLEDTQTSGIISSVCVTLSLNGNFNGLTSLIDDIGSEKFLKIKVMKYTADEARITVLFEIFLSEPVTFP